MLVSGVSVGLGHFVRVSDVSVRLEQECACIRC